MSPDHDEDDDNGEEEGERYNIEVKQIPLPRTPVILDMGVIQLGYTTCTERPLQFYSGIH